MKIVTLVLMLVWCCFGQKQNGVQTGISDQSALNRIDPSSVYASRPGSPSTGQVWTMTDKQCDGTGSGPAACRWNGSSWDSIGSGGGTQTNIFGSGTTVQRYVQCAYGTVNSTAVAALGAVTAGEITIQTSVAGTVRFDQVLVSETTQFTGTAWTALTVSMGRTGSTLNAELTGVNVPLMQSSGDSNFWSTRPTPPVVAAANGPYTLVLNFISTGGNLSAATAGVLTWEVCGYASR